MNKFKKILEDLKKELDEMSFSQSIREARDRIGLLQYRAAEHVNMTLSRMKNLETGYFRVMPSAAEIRDLCEFYQLPQAKMILKAEQHIAQRSQDKKVRTIHG